MKSVSLTAFLVVLLAAVSQAQSFQAHIMYFNDGSGQQPIRDLCIGGNPIPDGTVIQIVWDNDGNGPDTDDPRPVLCDYPPTCIGGPSGSVNFNEFLANGGEQNYGEGYFNVTTSWIGVGAIPSPSRYYLRVCLPNLHWVSNVFNINSGVQDIVIGSWTCMEQLCQGENPGFYAELYYYRPTPLYDGCGGITPLPDGTVVQILWDNDLDGPDLGDPRPELCADPPFCYSGPAGTVNFNEFTMNGGVLGLGEGYFYTETGFFSANRLPPLPRYYLRICLPTERWESNVFTLLSGPQEVEITSWTCVPASCSGESLPFQARLIHTVSPLTDECGGGSPLPDGTPIQIFWDTDSDGPDAEDPMPEVCLFPPDCITGPEGTVNYNTFALNGQSLEIGPGKFISEIMFSSVGYLLVPPRFYLRVGTSSLTWESNVFVLHAGVQDAIMSSWTCIDSVFSSCVAPPRPLNLLVSDNRCDGIHLNWSYPDSGVGNDTIAIYRDDVMIALRSALLPDSFVDTQAPVGTFLYGIEARRTCPESSSSSVSPRSWRLGSRLPDPPTAFGVQASDDLCDSVRISWEYSTNIGLDSFLVKRDGVRVGAVGRPSFPGYTVFRHVTTEREPAEYTVVGWSAQCGEGEPSLADSGKAWHEPTGIQQILATDGLCHVTQIQWDNSSLDATAYQVWRANYDGSSPSLMATVPLNETSFLDSTATPWVEYRYWIVATNPCGSGPESVFDLGSRIREPLQVGNVQATDSVSCDSVTVTWNDLSHETGYVILRNGTRLDTVGMDVTVFQDTTAASGVSYAYTVQAFNACGNGPLSQSNAGSVIRLPATVSSFSASDNRCDSIICTWTDLTNEGWYLLYRNGELLDSLPANTVRYADSPPAGTYSFGIVAANSCGLGSLRQDSGRRMAPLGLVTGIVASDDSCELVRIVWNNNISGEDSFQVRRDGLRIGVTPPNVTALNDTSAGINVRYLYSVVAYNTCGEGAVAAGDSGGRACIPRITVIQPNGGESWFIQDTANIRWNSRYISENVRIEINRSYPSGVWETIAENTDDNGSFYWPVAGPTTSSARIRVTGVASSFVGDTSNANFSIGRRSLAVSVPNGGETWIIGDTYAITWTSANLPGNVRIELNRGYPAGEWETVSASTPNDGSQLWVVSEPVAGVARVRIVGVSYPWIGDTTDADFSIARRSLTLVQPVGGESCAMGIPYDIMWTSENLTGTIRIELNRAFPEGTWATLTANAPNTGLYTWTPSYPATDRARIRVKSVNFPLLADTSDADFFIPSPLPEQLPGTASNPVPVDGETFVSSTPRLSWYPAPRAERYNVFLWPDTLPEPTSPIAANLTEISYQVGTSLQYGRMYNWRIVSTNLYGEAPGPVWSFRVRTLPNLTVSQVQVPPEAYSGQPYQVSWIVTNTGSAATSSPVWYDRLYLSPQPEYNGQLVTYLGQYENVSFLPSGASYTNSATFTLPQGITGDYYVFARTDFSGHVQESSENDNLGRNDDPMHVNLTPPPDLQVTNIISPANAFSGQSVSMTWTVQNRGTGPTIVGTWSDAVYLSRDTLLSGDDHALGATQHVGILLPDSSYQGSRIVTLPQTIYGAFYFLVQTDIGNSVYEFVFEQNNTEYSDTLTVTLTPPPDLIVSDLVVPTSGTAGQPLSIQWTVLNNGPGTPFENSWNDRVYASLDTALNLATATVLGSYSRTGALPPDSSYTRAATANLPSSLFGSVFIYVKTDYNNQVFEHTSEDNNVRRSSLPVEVSAAPWPDLVVTSVTAPSTAGSGQNVSVEWTVQNQGPGSVPQTTWNDRIFLSTSATFDSSASIPLATISRSGTIAPSGTYAAQANVLIPHGISGTYYVYVWSDVLGQVFEHLYDGNNVTRSDAAVAVTLSPWPDLVVSNITLPATGNSGQPVTIAWMVLNQGPGSSGVGPWVDRVYLSRSPVYHPDSVVVLQSQTHAGALAPSASYPAQATVSLPEGISGNYYVYVAADADNQIYEYQFEDNNIGRSSGSMEIYLTPWPDLRVHQISVAASANAGESLSVTYGVINDGLAGTPNSVWTDKVYLSANSSWNPGSATLLATRIHTGPLAVMGSYVETVIGTVPSNISGTYYVYVTTDAENQVYEYGAENNNTLRSEPLTVNPYPVNIAAQSVTGPDSAFSGQSVTVAWTVGNVGTVPTIVGSWQDAVYLSQDAILNTGTDLLLTTLQRTGVLSPGQTYTRDRVVTLPNGISGNYYLIARTDANNQIGDIDLSNNVIASATPMMVQLTPPPDLDVIAFTMPVQANAGQPITARWSVQNIGTGPTIRTVWYDAIYVSPNPTLDASDTRIATFTHNGALIPGQAYSDSGQVTIPYYLIGNYYLIVKTDSRDDEYELTGELNNTAAEAITIQLPPPSDLIVTAISLPASAQPGDQVTVSWTLQNQGSNPAVGWLRDAIYFSPDTAWDITDALLGYVNHYVDIAPGLTLTVNALVNLNETFRTGENGEIIGTMPGVTPGAYHALVRTDIRNSIPESDDLNNTGASASLISVDVPQLTLGVPTNGNLSQSERHFYRIAVEADLDLRVILDGVSQSSFNEFYVAFGRIPSLSDHDYAAAQPFLSDQELLIPTTEEGNYYLMLVARGSTTDYSIVADAMPFSILSVDPDHGGQDGRVTCTLRGAGFCDSTDVLLRLSPDSLIHAHVYEFRNSTELGARFYLPQVPLGTFDIVAMKPDGSTVTLPGAFTVEPRILYSATHDVSAPWSVRAGGTAVYSVTIQNTSNVDVEYVSASISTGQYQSIRVYSERFLMREDLIPDIMADSVPNNTDNAIIIGNSKVVPMIAKDVAAGELLTCNIVITDFTGDLQPFAVNAKALDIDGYLAAQTIRILQLQQMLLAENQDSLPEQLVALLDDTVAFVDTVFQGYIALGLLDSDAVDRETIEHLVAWADSFMTTEAGIMFQRNFAETVCEIAGFALRAADCGFAVVTCIAAYTAIVKGTIVSFGILSVPLATVLVPFCAYGFYNACVVGLFMPEESPPDITDVVQCFIGIDVKGKITRQRMRGRRLGPDFLGTAVCLGGLVQRQLCADVIRSRDPNDIIGPAGYGEGNFVARDQILPYTIRFENDPTLATAPAQVVHITQPLDPDLNSSSFRLGAFGFGNFVFTPPANRAYYAERLDVRDSLGLFIDVTAGIDVNTNEAFWVFESIDPATGEPPINPLVGFLAINDSITHRGEGFVTYTIVPRSTSQTGDTIHAQARIVFDVNDPIDTPPIFNTIDAGPPASRVDSNLTLVNETQIVVSWSGTDDAGGSGVKDYAVYVSADDGPFEVQETGLTNTPWVYTGEHGHTYGFFTLATDNVGNVEPMKTAAEAVSHIVPIGYGVPQAVTDLIIEVKTVNDTHEAHLHWSPVILDTMGNIIAVDGYEVYTDNSPPGQPGTIWKKIGKTRLTSFIHRPVPDGVHWYHVIARFDPYPSLRIEDDSGFTVPVWSPAER